MYVSGSDNLKNYLKLKLLIKVYDTNKNYILNQNARAKWKWKKNNEKLVYGLPEELLVWDYISR